jgi:ankyrin repeat protein
MSRHVIAENYKQLRRKLSAGRNVNNIENVNINRYRGIVMYKVVKLAYLLILIITITSCKTALINASEDGDLNRATVLLDQGADVNEGIFNGYNPLLAECWRFDAKIDMVKLLLDRGANVNYRDLNRKTALNISVINNRIDIVRLLLKYGASKDLTGCVHQMI